MALPAAVDERSVTTPWYSVVASTPTRSPLPRRNEPAAERRPSAPDEGSADISVRCVSVACATLTSDNAPPTRADDNGGKRMRCGSVVPHCPVAITVEPWSLPSSSLRGGKALEEDTVDDAAVARAIADAIKDSTSASEARWSVHARRWMVSLTSTPRASLWVLSTPWRCRPWHVIG